MERYVLLMIGVAVGKAHCDFYSGYVKSRKSKLDSEAPCF
ncbi:hypothetical protein TRICHSKD4_5569 [Roseibium sp. TrichSKD4]|nr:hypothetical protein TRICHSKD4_5569 [Roseibium sp. TrichSKD4]